MYSTCRGEEEKDLFRNTKGPDLLHRILRLLDAIKSSKNHRQSEVRGWALLEASGTHNEIDKYIIKVMTITQF